MNPHMILLSMAETFLAKNNVYGENYLNVGPTMKGLFPGGVTITTAEEFTRWHILELIVVKLSRFATSDLTHMDSIHDIGVYAAMLESILQQDAKRKEMRAL